MRPDTGDRPQEGSIRPQDTGQKPEMVWPAGLWPMEGPEVRQDRRKVRREEWGWALGSVGQGRFPAGQGRVREDGAWSAFRKPPSVPVPHSAGVTLTLPLWNQPGSFTRLCPDMGFPVRPWQEVPWWERVILHSEPWGFWEPTGQLARMHGSQCVPSSWWAGRGGSRVET